MERCDIDAKILQMVVERWQKTAMIIMKTDEALRKAGVEASSRDRRANCRPHFARRH
jgi:hypothetical protein